MSDTKESSKNDIESSPQSFNQSLNQSQIQSPSLHLTPLGSLANSFSIKEQEVRDQINLLTTLQNVKGMLEAQSWSLPELVFGIKWLHKNKKKRDFTDFISRSISLDDKIYEEFLYYLHHFSVCNCIDTKTRQEFLSSAGIAQDCLIEYFINSTPERNGYIILVDHQRKEVVLYINGTQTLNDMMLDLHGKASSFMGGYAHHGMALWAKWFYKYKSDTIIDLLEKNDNYQFLICGHSLGGATSCLAGFLMRKLIPNLKVLAIAVPKCLSEDLIEESEKFITTFVYMDDLVPLMSEHTWTELRQRVAQFNWKKEFVNDISSAAPVKALLKIAPASFQNLFKKEDNQDSSNESIDSLISRSRTSSDAGSPGSPIPVSEMQTTSVDMQRQRSISAPIRPIKPLGSLLTTIPEKSSLSKSNNDSDPIIKSSTPQKKTTSRFSFFWKKSSTSTTQSDIELSTPTSIEAANFSSSLTSSISSTTSIEETSIEINRTAKQSTKIYEEESLEIKKRKFTNPKPLQSISKSILNNSTDSSSDINDEDLFPSDIENYKYKIEFQSDINNENDSVSTLVDTSTSSTPKSLVTSIQLNTSINTLNNTPIKSIGTPTLLSPSVGTPNRIHDVIPLHNPGKIYYIRVIDGQWYITLEKWNSKFFEKLEFNRTFLRDHLSASYLNALQNVVNNYRLQKEMIGKKEALKIFLSLEDDLL